MLPFTDADLKSEISTKIARLQDFMEQKGYGGILLSQVRNFEWLTGGVGDNQVGRASEFGLASLLLAKDGRKFLVAAHSEIPRLMEDGLGDLAYQPVETPWYEKAPDLGKLLGLSGTIGSDVERDGCATVNVAPLRYQLSPAEILKYRWLGRECAVAVEQVTRGLQPGMREREIETQIVNALMKRGIRPTVLLIGTDDRIKRFRHALPSDRALEKYGMVNICAKRWGLIASVTRFVHFGALDAELKKRLHAVAMVNSKYSNALKPGAKISDIFRQATEWYAELGHPGEWKFHHQGGATGYSERDYLVAPDSTEIVLNHQAFAMNPTVQGTKAEDTIIVAEKRAENLSATPDWPKIHVELDGTAYDEPDILIQGATQTSW
jgi:Xaa-Pro aminopeptidase